MTPPRLFIAATRQDEGKTTTSVGLLIHLLKRFARVGFMKPVGQRYVELEDGSKVDKDVWLIRSSLGLADAPALMSPVTVPSRFTREYIDQRDPAALEARVTEAFAALSADKEFVLIEGTGHAGVGSVFDLSNARVAKLLGSPVVLVSGGGIGKPVDEIVLNQALFRQHGIELAGVILNKVLPEKLDEVARYAGRALAWHGITVLGVLPYVPLLSQPTLREVCHEIEGSFISAEDRSSTLFANVQLVSHYSQNFAQHVAPKTLLVSTGEQSDLLVACAYEEQGVEALRTHVAGIVLTEGIEPKHHIVKILRSMKVPVILTEIQAFQATSRVSQMVAKIQPDNPEKLEAISALFARHMPLEALLASVH